MGQEATVRDIPRVTFGDYFETFGGMAVKGFVFLVILGFITSPLWRSIYDTSNFWNYLLVGLAISFGLITALFLLGILNAIFGKIFSIFTPKQK